MKSNLRLRMVYLLFGLLAIFFEIGAAPALHVQQQGGWNTPTTISSNQVTGWFPDITSDSTGRVHVAWAAGTTGFDTVLYTSSTDGSNWQAINDIAAVAQNGTDSAATRPGLWVDNNGFLNLTYVSTTLYYSRAPIKSAGSAMAWSQPMKLNTNQVAYFSRIIQDSHGQLHLFYTENVISNNCSQCYHLFHRISADNGSTWSDPQDISADGTGAAKPQVIVDNKSDIFVVWESGIGGGLGQLSGPSVVKFAASYDFGATWTTSITLSPSTVQEAKNISLGLDKNADLVAVWLAVPDNTVNYLTSSDSGKTWSRSIPIDGISGSWDIYPSKLDDYSIAADSKGILHLVLVGQLGTAQVPTSTPAPNEAAPTPLPQPLSVLHLTWDGYTWSQPEVVTTFTGDVPEWPRAAVSNGNILNLVWFVRDQANIWNSDNAHYRIWYTREELDAPALATIVPTTSSTPTQPAISDNTPTLPQQVITSTDSIPTLSADEKLPVKATYTEDDYLTIFAKSLAPTVILIISAAITFLILRRRR
jgi:hypothetical protein